MEIRWLTNDEIDRLVNPTLRKHGWAELNINEHQPTCRVLGAFVEDKLIESFTFQMYPLLGPLVRHDPDVRDSGETSRQLTAVMEEFLEQSDARDFIVVANSPVTVRLCKRFGMAQVDVPVFSRRRAALKEDSLDALRAGIRAYDILDKTENE